MIDRLFRNRQPVVEPSPELDVEADVDQEPQPRVVPHVRVQMVAPVPPELAEQAGPDAIRELAYEGALVGRVGGDPLLANTELLEVQRETGELVRKPMRGLTQIPRERLLCMQRIDTVELGDAIEGMLERLAPEATTS